MGQINIYKINPQKQKDFFIRLDKDFSKSQNKSILKDSSSYTLVFYYKTHATAKEISWAWVFSAYGINPPKVEGSPKGVLTIISKKNQAVYAVTFGSAFFCVDKFCDRDFGFEYACRVPYSNIRLTALTNPVSARNKTINSYQNYNVLDFDSGESFAKIKGKMGLSEDDDFFKDSIEVGTAIKFQLKNDSLDNIINLILHIEEILKRDKQIKIPRFNIVKDKERISLLQNNLISAIKKQIPQVLVSEFTIIGSMEIFNRYDSYKLSYKRNNEEFSELNLPNIVKFCENCNIETTEEWLDIKVAFMVDGEQKDSTSLLSILDFMDEGERCLLVQGDWYEFNDDYLTYLKDSLSEIPVLYNQDFDLTQTKLDQFQGQKVIEEKEEYEGKTIDEIRKIMKSKYYAERAFNEMRVLDGFTLGDRKNISIGRSKIEVADLYRDDAIFSVKRGKSSADFSYVAEQSSMAVSAYKNGTIKTVGNIKKIVIWLIFERSQKLSLHDNCLEWDELNMLVLKNRLDQWKKEVRLAGFQPEIWINYQTED